jgi:nucleotide-binding universal stress UspA family protein
MGTTSVSPVVVGYIDTAEGKAALQRAIREARLRSAPLVVVSSQRGRDEPEHAPDENNSELDAIRSDIEAAGVVVTVRHVARGQDPANDLVSIADELAADLIVIGLRRRSPVGKLVMGSNSQQVLLEANCAVLAVKATS